MPLRWRLTLWYLGLTAVSLLAFDLISYQLLANSLRAEIDNTLIERANHVTDAVSVIPNRPIQGISPSATDEFRSPGVYVQIFNAEGAVVARSFNLGTQQLPLTATALEQVLVNRAFSQTTTIAGQSVRLYHRLLRREGVTLGVVQVGQSLAGLESTLRRLQLIYIAGTAVILLFGLLGSRWLVSRSLQPITHIAQTAHDIAQATDLARRVDDVGTADEIGTLVATFNDMLDRLEHIFTSQQRFLAEAAHELRTPLATLLGNVDLFVRHHRDDQRQEEAMAAIQRLGHHLARLLDDLLLLAQAEAGWHLQLSPVAVDNLFLELYESLLLVANGSRLQLQRCDPAQILGDPDRLRQVFSNLIDNALKHTQASDKICLSLWPENGRVWIQISDAGSGIPPAALDRIYDPFFRVSNEKQQLGAGLGLTIVHWIVQEHDGQIDIQSSLGQGTTITLSFPEFSSN